MKSSEMTSSELAELISWMGKIVASDLFKDRPDALCKFKIGDLVWHMDNNKPRQSIVASIVISHLRPHLEYFLHRSTSLDSCDGRNLVGNCVDINIFRTKEELIASL